MSLKKVEQVKKDKGFRIFDLVIYAAVAVIVAVLFIVVFATRDTGDLKGVRVYSDNVAVFECGFDDNVYNSLAPRDKVEVLENDHNFCIFNVYCEDGYNKIVIDKNARTVTVTDADCRSHECVNMADIKDKNGVIYCSPHRLRIEPYDYNPDPDYIPVG